MMMHANLVKELAARARVDEKAAEQTLRALGFDDRFDTVAGKLGEGLRLDDLRLGFKVAHGHVVV